MDDLSKKQAYKKFSYRGLDITKLISLTPDEVSQHLRSRQRRRLKRKMKKICHLHSKIIERQKIAQLVKNQKL